MGLTANEKMLIRGLKSFKVPKGMALRIFLMLETDSQQVDLMRYMAAHTKATPEKFLSMAENISKKASYNGD